MNVFSSFNCFFKLKKSTIDDKTIIDRLTDALLKTLSKTPRLSNMYHGILNLRKRLIKNIENSKHQQKYNRKIERKMYKRQRYYKIWSNSFRPQGLHTIVLTVGAFSWARIAFHSAPPRQRYVYILSRYKLFNMRILQILSKKLLFNNTFILVYL